MKFGASLPEWFPYAFPMGLFVALTALEGALPGDLYPFVYGFKTLSVAAALVLCAPAWWHELRPTAAGVGWAIGVGILSYVLWILLDRWTPHWAFLGSRAAFNPFERIGDPDQRAVFIVVRVIGMSLLVPLMEEVFWRSFLLRYLTDPERWQRLPLGRPSATAVGISVLLFSSAHPEWLAAAVFALTMTWLCRATGNLAPCVVAHATTNLALAVHVLLTGNWAYW